MSTSPNATAVKKSSQKQAVTETTRRIRPIRIKGWMEVAANAYGITPSTRNVTLTGPPEYTVKSKNEDGTMLMVSKPTQILVPGLILEANDERVLVRMDDTVVGLFRSLEDSLLEQLSKHANTEGKSDNHIHYGDNLLRLKTKYFKGRYTHKYVKGEKDETAKYEDLTNKRVEIIVRFYGLYVTDDMYGPLASVGAYNVLE